MALTALALVAPVALAGCVVGGRVATAPCRPNQISISTGEFAIGRGRFAGVLLFTNASRSACTLHGYPVARGVGPRRTDRWSIAHDRRVPGRSGAVRPSTVLLVPGAAAAAVLEGGTAGRCPTSSGLLLGLPGARPTVVLAVELRRCAEPEVGPFQAARSAGRGPPAVSG